MTWWVTIFTPEFLWLGVLFLFSQNKIEHEFVPEFSHRILHLVHITTTLLHIYYYYQI